MKACPRLALLLAGVAVSIYAQPHEPTETNQDTSTPLADAIATHNRAPDVPSVRLYEPDPEDRQAPVRIPKAACQCTIVNNQCKCRPVRPGFGSVLRRLEEKS